jgi:hypothetical protein
MSSASTAPMPRFVRSVVPFFVLLSVGCYQGVNPDVQKIQCQSDSNCPVPYVCVKQTGASFGACMMPGATADAGVSKDGTVKDGTVDETVGSPADARLSADIGATAADTGDAQVSSLPDATTDSAGPAATVDAPVTPDAPMGSPDTALIGAPDVGPDVGPDATVGKDAAPPCNGGCCSNADCPLATPVCNAANKCVACSADQDCNGRSATACNPTTGACVQCTKDSQCGGTTATCNTSTNTCVGCTQRSDCPGTCQTCSNGSCVAVKNADDPSKCDGTCDSAGECKAKKGQKCASVAGGCLSGTTCSPDGVCCDRACTGSCEACDLSASPGTCTVLPSGSAPHAGHAACAGTNECAGTCTGAANGACTFPTGTCGSASCSANASQAAGTCNQGSCTMPAPVTCKPGATCSGNACACPLGTSDCTSACANLDSDPKHCGACGHDCLGGTCEGGYCKPFKLGEVATGYVGRIVPDGDKVYAITQQMFMFDTTKVWVTDASTPGIPVKVPPDNTHTPSCVMDGILLWQSTSDANSFTFQYCSASACASSTQSFTHTPAPPTAGWFNMDRYPECDPAKKEIVWSESFTPEAGGDSTITILRSTIDGKNVRAVASFSLENGETSAYANGFAIGRTDRYFFSRTTGSTTKLYMVSTTGTNASPVLLGSGSSTGPLDTSYALLYANDSLLAWSQSSQSTSYRIPLPNGVGTSAPPVFYTGEIVSGIMDNFHMYGFFTNLPSTFSWCSATACSPSTLPSGGSGGQAYAQDSGAIYWGEMDASDSDGFSIWKVAKQPY